MSKLGSAARTALGASFNASQEGVCTGLRPGSSGLNPELVNGPPRGVPAPNLRNPDDPQGWHRFFDREGPTLRRARRIDITLSQTIRIDASFQDSAILPGRERSIMHEYRIFATADPDSGKLLSLRAEPHVLPFIECPMAMVNLSRLDGTPLQDLRASVPEKLPRTDGCTHLNDALRAFAEVPLLARMLVRTLEECRA